MTANPQARLSIVAYKAKPGKEAELMSLAQEHVPYLRSLGFATERPHMVATAADGTIVEIFEWAEGGLEKAHSHPGLGEMWMRYAAACDFVPLKTLEEAGAMFANFVPVN
ncbi:MAG: hypothetical protein M3Z09_13970 [Acidobacteriota bacterium]|nr:hypothetical protein [Acidobacteriota bacterium]